MPATATKERPVLFSGPMVRAILDGRKTQTRRVIGLDQLHPSETPGYDWTFRGQAPIRTVAQQRRRAGGCWQEITRERMLSLCPYGVPGDRLWVRENLYRRSMGASINSPHYEATEWRYADGSRVVMPAVWPTPFRVRSSIPSIHMPRWASRLTLEIKSVRVDRVQEISEADSKAEGVTLRAIDCRPGWAHRAAFEELWDSINGKRLGCDWASNPYVWVVEFERVAQGKDGSSTGGTAVRKKKRDPVSDNAADNAMLLAAIIAGQARWEPWQAGGSGGEVCVDGLRYSTTLNEVGCPDIGPHIRAALIRASSK